MGQVVNWLTSFRLFLDHSERSLKRRFDDDSPQVRRFKQKTADAYDTDVGYRFTGRFRNYVQHCGRPLSGLVIGRTVGSDPSIKQSISFLLNRDLLLAQDDFEWGAKVKEDLKNMSETFELQPLAESAMDRLREIDSLLLDIVIEGGARTIGDVREAASLLPADVEGIPNLFRFIADEHHRITSITPTPFALGMVEEYEQISSGLSEPSDWHGPPQIEMPVIDPEMIRRDSRAVDGMTVFHAGGMNQEFYDWVRRVVDADGGVEPMLTGMFHMSAVLMYMTATAIGTDPLGLLGGLLDLYEPPAT